MSANVLNEAFLVKAAGSEVVVAAKSLLGSGKVLSSSWTPPLLKGVVQEGTASYRAGLVIKGAVDIENLCPCRAAREAGVICSHSVAVGLHHLRRVASVPRGKDTATPLPWVEGVSRPVAQSTREPEPPPGPKLRRSAQGTALRYRSSCRRLWGRAWIGARSWWRLRDDGAGGGRR